MNIKPASASPQVFPKATSSNEASIKFQETCSSEENDERSSSQLDPASSSECNNVDGEPEPPVLESVGFGDDTGLAKHLMVHSCTQSFQCELCECKRLDKSRCNSLTHFHTREKPVRCRNCGCQSLGKTYFAKNPTGANGFVCGMCSFQACSLDLNEHTSEAGAKSFVCGTGEASFEQKSLLQQYIEKKLFECSTCNYKTISKAKLEQHKLLLHLEDKPKLVLGLASNKKGLSRRVAAMLRNKILSRRLHHGAL